jgi:hypothetical protein
LAKKEEEIEKGRGNGFIDENRRVKMMVATNKIDYDDYLSSCKLLKNGGGKDKTVNDCEFRGTDGGYTCFSLKISNEVVGTVSVESRTKISLPKR